MADWQPIGTAPKDGSRVDMWVKNLLTWDNRGERRVNLKWGPCINWLGQEYEGWGLSEDCQPTHWMPVPAAPEAE